MVCLNAAGLWISTKKVRAKVAWLGRGWGNAVRIHLPSEGDAEVHLVKFLAGCLTEQPSGAGQRSSREGCSCKGVSTTRLGKESGSSEPAGCAASSMGVAVMRAWNVETRVDCLPALQKPREHRLSRLRPCAFFRGVHYAPGVCTRAGGRPRHPCPCFRRVGFLRPNRTLPVLA